MVMAMMKKIVSLWAASFAFFFLSGCDRAPSSGERQAAPSAEREKLSAVRKEAEIWRERLDAAVAGAGREKENGSEHVKALPLSCQADGRICCWINQELCFLSG